MFFESDNTAPIAPEIISAIKKLITVIKKVMEMMKFLIRQKKLIREVFESPEASVFFVSTGTAANAIALSCLCPPWATIFCHENSHIENDECNAPEFLWWC